MAGLNLGGLKSPVKKIASGVSFGFGLSLVAQRLFPDNPNAVRMANVLGGFVGGDVLGAGASFLLSEGTNMSAQGSQGSSSSVVA